MSALLYTNYPKNEIGVTLTFETTYFRIAERMICYVLKKTDMYNTIVNKTHLMSGLALL